MELSKDKEKIEVKQGEFLTCNNIIQTDCDLYNRDTGEIIFSFKKNVIDDTHYNNLHKGIINHARTISNNRGNSAGKVSITGLNKHQENWKPEAHPVELVDKNGIKTETQSSSSFFKYADGRLSKRARSNNVMSSAIGGFDKNAGNPCRLTHYTKNNLQKYVSVFPLCEKISELYFSYFPNKWYSQFNKYEQCPKEFVIPNTNFSTITLNCDFRTATHVDKGDAKEGLTCFTILKNGEFTGGELIFPEYNIAVNVCQGDLLIFDPHQIHCNNPLQGSGRVSFVFYLRNKMNLCENKT